MVKSPEAERPRGFLFWGIAYTDVEGAQPNERCADEYASGARNMNLKSVSSQTMGKRLVLLPF
jgi:hypothetical protein